MPEMMASDDVHTPVTLQPMFTVTVDQVLAELVEPVGEGITLISTEDWMWVQEFNRSFLVAVVNLLSSRTPRTKCGYHELQLERNLADESLIYV